MKSIKKKRVLFVLGIVAFLLHSCTKDELFTDEHQELAKELTFGKNSELTIAAAKEWYINNEPAVTRMGVTQGDISGVLVTPSWNHTKEWKKGKYEVVEASLRSNMNTLLYDQDTRMQKDGMSKKERSRIMNVARAVILKDITTGEIITFNMVFIGSLNYLMKYDDLSDNNYLHRTPHFDGMVLYFSPSGEFVNGWKYSNGKIIKHLSPVLDEEALSDTLSSATTRSIQCHTSFYTESYYYCPPITRSAFMEDWSNYYGTGEFGGGLDNDNGGNSGGGDTPINGGELDGPVVTAPSCYWTSRLVPFVECYDDGSTEGGGGYNPQPTPPSVPEKSRIEKIILKADSLSIKEKELLEKAIGDMEKKICYAKQILDYLESEGIAFNSVYMNPQLGGGMANAGNVVSSDGTIKLVFRDPDDITYGSFAHELVHLFQKHLGAYSGFQSRGMMEYERALIDDIMYYSNIHGVESDDNNDTWLEKARRSPFAYGDEVYGEGADEYQEKKQEYLNWLSGLTKNGTPNYISNDDFNKWISLFSDYSKPYSPDRGYEYNMNYTPNALMKALELAANCY